MEKAELLLDSITGEFYVKDPRGSIVTVEDYKKFYKNGDLYISSEGYTAREKFLEQVAKAREEEML